MLTKAAVKKVNTQLIILKYNIKKQLGEGMSASGRGRTQAV